MIATGFLQGLTDDVMKIVALATGAAIVLLAWIIATAWSRIRHSENRAALIGMMLQRGMNAEQIERVLNAGGFSGSTDGSDGVAPDVRIINVLKENAYSGDDVEEILDAAKHHGRIDAGAADVVESLVEQEAKTDEIIGVLRVRRNNTPVGARA